MKPREMVIRVLVFSFLFSACAFQSLRASPHIGLSVQTWRYEPATQQVTVRLVNSTNKDITAFNLSVTVKYTDGTVNSSEKTTDYLPLMVVVEAHPELRGEHGNGTFAAGTSRDVTFPESRDPKDVLLTVDMVAYADRTADVANQRAFDHLIAGRKEVALATEQADQVIKDAMAGPNPKDVAAKELTRLADVARGSGGAGLTEMTLRGHAQSVRQASDLAVLVKDGETKAAVYNAHTQLVRGVQP